MRRYLNNEILPLLAEAAAVLGETEDDPLGQVEVLVCTVLAGNHFHAEVRKQAADILATRQRETNLEAAIIRARSRSEDDDLESPAI